MNKVFFVIVLICSLPVLLIGLNGARQNIMEAENFLYTEGTVTGNSSAQFFDNGNVSEVYVPRVEFFLPNGERKVFTDKVGSFPADYGAGESVTVVYNPLDPQQCRIYSWKRVWLIPLILVISGCLPGAVLAIVSAKIEA